MKNRDRGLGRRRKHTVYVNLWVRLPLDILEEVMGEDAGEHYGDDPMLDEVINGVTHVVRRGQRALLNTYVHVTDMTGGLFKAELARLRRRFDGRFEVLGAWDKVTGLKFGETYGESQAQAVHPELGPRVTSDPIYELIEDDGGSWQRVDGYTNTPVMVIAVDKGTKKGEPIILLNRTKALPFMKRDEIRDGEGRLTGTTPASDVKNDGLMVTSQTARDLT